MTKHILFLIHGIGAHEADIWAEEENGPIDTLKKVSQKYGYFQRKSLEEKVEFIPVNYDSIFQDTIAQWRQDIGFISQLDPTGKLAEATSWLANSAENEQSFWWNHVADLAMYRLSPLYRQRVRIHVIEQIASHIEVAKIRDGEAQCSVLAHSMGTAVVHDCLHLLGTEKWGNNANPLNPRHWRFNHLFMVSNTSRCLQTEDGNLKKAYQSIVRPGSSEDPASYCSSYWNFRHEADPVSFVRMFEPVGWRRYEDIAVRHCYAVNIHALSHYLINPRVHIPILRKLTSPRAVKPEEEINAVKNHNFPQFSGPAQFVENAKKLQTELHELQARLGEEPSVKDWFVGLVEFFKMLEAHA